MLASDRVFSKVIGETLFSEADPENFDRGGQTDWGHFRVSRQHHKKGQAGGIGLRALYQLGTSRPPGGPWPPWPPGVSAPEFLTLI